MKTVLADMVKAELKPKDKQPLSLTTQSGPLSETDGDKLSVSEQEKNCDGNASDTQVSVIASIIFFRHTMCLCTNILIKAFGCVCVFENDRMYE